jgi:hypothetical protein
MSGLCISTSGQTVVRVEDFAVFLMILKCFSANMNEDGSLPVARWRQLWNSLFRCGEAVRPILAIGEDKWRLNPEEIARFITPIHEMIGLAA